MRQVRVAAIARQAGRSDHRELRPLHRPRRLAGAGRLLGRLVRPLQDDGPGIPAGGGRDGHARALRQGRYRGAPAGVDAPPYPRHSQPHPVPQRPGGGAYLGCDGGSRTQTLAGVAGHSARCKIAWLPEPMLRFYFQGDTMADQQQPVFNIEKLFVKDLSVEVPNAPDIYLDREAPQIDVNMSTESRALGEDLYHTGITVTVTAQIGDKTMFLVECTQAGIFRIQNVPQDQLPMVLGIGCPNIVFPYLRETVSDVVIALLRLFQPHQIGIEIFLFRPGRAVDALQHLVLRIAA